MAVVGGVGNGTGVKKRDIFYLLGFQALFIILYVIFLRYDDKYKSSIYPMFQDVHAMIFVGFGFLMTFMKRYSFSGVGFNFLLAAVVTQWAILCEGFFSLDEHNYIRINLVSLLRADVAAATILISMGALLGRTSYMQLIVMGIIEMVVFSANSALGEYFQVKDTGDSIFVHAFGAYFGLAVSYVLIRRTDTSQEDSSTEESSYNSDIFAMIGTVFLWIFWPSFNAAESIGDDQQRAIINTYLSLLASCVTAYAISAIFSEDRKFDMVHVQNSTLAGGVAIGTAASLMVQPWGALIIGSAAGALSVCGFAVLSPCMRSRFRIPDTCGVHNLHGMPAVFAALVGALMAWIATEDQYNMNLYQIYPARAPSNAQPTDDYPFLAPGQNRTATEQAGYQLLGIAHTLVIAIVSGLITGFLVSGPIASRVLRKDANKDDPFWLVHEHEHEQEQAITSIPIKVYSVTGELQPLSSDIPHSGNRVQDNLF